MRPLAESPEISGSVVLIILLVLAIGLTAAGVMIWQGCVLALGAGRGDRRALMVWAVIAAVEVVLSLAGFVIVFGPALLAQVALYLRGLATPPSSGGGPAPPTHPPES